MNTSNQEASSIRILDPEVVAKIAAGEVVERPASVVKELLDNALDAGARNIDVAIEHGGAQLISVTDNGSGMTPAGTRLSLKRHATSKLRTIDDLQSVSTMGFRGEGLFCIAAVSHLAVTTRPAEQASGYYVLAVGGEIIDEQPVGCSPGTRVEVRDLFFNTPVRRKFLKSQPTEATHVVDCVTEVAAANPHVAIALTVDGRIRLQFPRHRDRRERAQWIYHRRVTTLASSSCSDEACRLELHLSRAEDSVRTPRSLILVVNGRVIRDRALLHAVAHGYSDQLKAGYYPLGLVYLDLPPAQVDVNVHPQKKEVRLEHLAQVCSALRIAARELLNRPGEIGTTFAVESQAAVRSYALRPLPAADSRAEQSSLTRRLEEARRRFWSRSSRRRLGGSRVQAERSALELNTGGRAAEDLALPFGLHLLCQTARGWWIFEREEELVVLVADRCWRRVVEAQLLLQVRDGGTPAFDLVRPTPIRLTVTKQRVFEQQSEALAALGFVLENHGGDTWAIRSIPLALRGVEPAPLVDQLLGDLAEARLRTDDAPGICRWLATWSMPPPALTPSGLLAAVTVVGLRLADLTRAQASASGEAAGALGAAISLASAESQYARFDPGDDRSEASR
jgi:DNA mismatch repair protein MutL